MITIQNQDLIARLIPKEYDKFMSELEDAPTIKWALSSIITAAREEGRVEMGGMTDDEAQTTAESLIRPFLTSAALFGITPDHKWRNRDRDPLELRQAILRKLRSIIKSEEAT